LERAQELALIDAVLERATSGSGGALLITGAAGIGKTTLIEAARQRSAAAGLTVLSARGGEMEGDFAYGVMRQLLEAPVIAATEAQRERLLNGAAALAVPAVVAPPSVQPQTAVDPYARIHGIYWLIFNLAAEGPIALLIDDAHWADAPSLEALNHLVHRLDGLPIAVLVSIRTGDETRHQHLLDALIEEAAAETCSPNPLSDEGVGRVLAAELNQRPDPAFVAASQALTGGNPFLVHELALALHADAREPSAAAVANLGEVGPATVARSTLARLGRLSPDAVAIARTIAILDREATLARAVSLSELDERRALIALDALHAAHVVQATEQLQFNHPIVRRAIYDELAPGQRSLAHVRAAELLAAEGAEPETVAGHLLLTQPLGSVETIEMLRAAAAHALNLGAPQSAIAYLERALAEGPDLELRIQVVSELGMAELLARRPSALERFEELYRLSDDPVVRATALLQQAQVVAYTDFPRAKGLLERVAIELDDSSHPVVRRAEALWAVIAAHDPRLVDSFIARIPHLQELIADGGPGGPSLAFLLASWMTHHDESPDVAIALFEAAWDDGNYLTAGESIEILPHGISTLIAREELDRAEEMIETLRANAAVSGSFLDFLLAMAHSMLVATRRGDLGTAAAELRYTIERTLELGLVFGTTSLLSFGADALLERPDLSDIATLAETVPLGPMAEVYAGAMLIEVRGRLRFANGRRDEGIADVRYVGEMSDALGFSHSYANPTWRSTLALMLGPDAQDEALALVEKDLTLGRAANSARRTGIALRGLGLIEPDADAALAHLQESVAVLAASPARLEHARSLVELGAALRRRGQRAAAREPLREGLDLAHRCGAVRLAERAETELGATGARPRRGYVSGVDALTPSELRVARLAAEGRTSKEIAQSLFVTTKTVDTHLGHLYAKLDISGRAELESALNRE
jgi:DNA-binding CsgD family transcriptional regulator